MRTDQHVIDSKAVKKVLRLFPDHWVIRDLSERDYGIDLLVEVFAPSGANRFGATFEATGAMLNVQIKGTRAPLHLKPVKSLNVSIPRRTLGYAEKFSTPFVLIRISVDHELRDVYFLWLQGYVREHLDSSDPNWRISDKKNVSLSIPTTNNADRLVARLEQLAYRPKYFEELAEFVETYGHIKFIFDGHRKTNTRIDTDTCLWLADRAERLLHLTTLLRMNSCCIDATSIRSMQAFFREEANSDVEWTERQNLDLLEASIQGQNSTDRFEAENEGFTVY